LQRLFQKIFICLIFFAEIPVYPKYIHAGLDFHCLKAVDSGFDHVRSSGSIKPQECIKTYLLGFGKFFPAFPVRHSKSDMFRRRGVFFMIAQRYSVTVFSRDGIFRFIYYNMFLCQPIKILSVLFYAFCLFFINYMVKYIMEYRTDDINGEKENAKEEKI